MIACPAVNYIEIAVIGFALAIDAMVYSFSYGLVLSKKRVISSIWLALVVGTFQMAMPLLGYMGGAGVREVVLLWTHWIVLGIFSALGSSIIYQAWKTDSEANPHAPEPLCPSALVLVGLATSIDALAAGAGMALGNIGGTFHDITQQGLAVTLIGIITFLCSLLAFHIARLFKHMPTHWLKTTAGLILVLFGIQAILKNLITAP